MKALSMKAPVALGRALRARRCVPGGVARRRTGTVVVAQGKQDKPRNAAKRGPAVPHVSQTDEASAASSSSDSRDDTREDPQAIWDNEWLFDEALSVGQSQEFEGPSCDLQAGEAALATVAESSRRAEPARGAEGSSSDSGGGNGGSNGNGSSSSRSKARALNSHRIAPEYGILQVYDDGTVQQQSVKRRLLLRNTGLQPRDLRRIDPSAASNSAPFIVVRDNVLLVHIHTVRIAVFANYCILFNHQTKASKRFLHLLSSRLALCAGARVLQAAKEAAAGGGGSATAGNGGNGWRKAAPVGGGMRQPTQFMVDDALHDWNGSDEWNARLDADHYIQMGEAGNTASSFELEVLEAALSDAISEVEVKLSRATNRVDKILRVVPYNMNAAALEALRSLKQELVELDTRAGAIRTMLLDVLDDEEDIRDMLISKAHLDDRTEEEIEEDEEEVEGLLEYHLQKCETYHNEAERLLENMRDLEESVALSLSARRFEVSKLELWLHVLSFAVSNGALVTGVFGMNLLSNLEMHPTLFYCVVAAIFCSIVAITALIFLYISSRLRTHARTSAQELLLRRAKRRNKRSWKMKMKDVQGGFAAWRLNLDFLHPKIPDLDQIRSDLPLDETMDEGPPPRTARPAAA